MWIVLKPAQSRDFPLSLCLSLCHTPQWSGCVSTGTIAPRALSSCAAKLIITTDYTSSQQPWHFQGRWHDDKIILEMRYHSHSLSRPLSLQSSFFPPFDFYLLLIRVFYSALVFRLLSLSYTLLQFTSNFLSFLFRLTHSLALSFFYYLFFYVVLKKASFFMSFKDMRAFSSN